MGGEVIRTANAIDGPVRGSRRIKTLYDVLGVRSDADEQSIERAFREASKAYHPDLHGGDSEATSRFKDIAAAAAVLRDPDRRAAYDVMLRRERRRRREWAAVTILGVAASAIIGFDLSSGRLMFLFGPARTVSATPSVAISEPSTNDAQQPLAPTAGVAQPGELNVATAPTSELPVAQKPDALLTGSESAPAPTVSVAPSPQHLDASEIASLVKRGAELMANGNIAAARQLFEPAAEAGDPAAANALAETYDPSVLEKLGAKAITPNIALARRWYERAKALGSTAAGEW
jgi:TPR repeat protein